MDEGKFWAAIMRYIVTGIVVVVIAVIASCQTSKYQITRAIEAGADPLEAKCALEGGNQDARQSDACLLLYAGKAQSKHQPTEK